MKLPSGPGPGLAMGISPVGLLTVAAGSLRLLSDEATVVQVGASYSTVDRPGPGPLNHDVLFKQVTE